MKSTTGWYNDLNGTNSSGFNGLPGGQAHPLGFADIEHRSLFWTSSVNDSQSPFFLALYHQDNNCVLGEGVNDAYTGYSARCVKD